jgi:hypothetical protein
MCIEEIKKDRSREQEKDGKRGRKRETDRGDIWLVPKESKVVTENVIAVQRERD